MLHVFDVLFHNRHVSDSEETSGDETPRGKVPINLPPLHHPVPLTRCHSPDPFAGLQDLGEGRSYTDLSFLTSSRPPQFSSVNHNPSDTSPLIIPNGRSAREFSNTINAPGYQDMQGFKGKRLRPNTQLCLVNPSWSCFLRHQPFAHVRQEKQSTSKQPNVHTTKPGP
ncbi:hypothetical protein DPEC_G00094920 [Dallia pectoralis]|uniref:Uncharacterized protein n=1 Tax=Dallia pectoralis TaxID=75939 RepID=A0ACC2GV26_DALPE|nr:hypothetical protein DPEC_G00094920 [Dallia pectoralis]